MVGNNIEYELCPEMYASNFMRSSDITNCDKVFVTVSGRTYHYPKPEGYCELDKWLAVNNKGRTRFYHKSEVESFVVVIDDKYIKIK